jgi:hypothetical protein
MTHMLLGAILFVLVYTLIFRPWRAARRERLRLYEAAYLWELRKQHLLSQKLPATPALTPDLPQPTPRPEPWLNGCRVIPLFTMR